MQISDQTRRRAIDFVEAAQGDLHLEAHKLVQRYREVLQGLLLDERERLRIVSAANHQKTPFVWAPLNFAAREVGPSLYLEWRITRPARKSKVPIFGARVPKLTGRGMGNYDLRKLIALAPSYMQHLVEETETEARYLRQRLKHLTDARRSIDKLLADA